MSYQQIGARLRAVARRVANLKRELGGMMFSGLISCVGLTALSVFAINVCSEALERERMQNAADASAYASATWFARGMNAITSLNHQLGEKTAYTVIAEAMAGPESSIETSASKEEKEIDQLLKKLKGEAPNDKRPAENSPTNSIINGILKSKISGGALYDAKMRLLYGQAILFNNKSRANDLQKAGDHMHRTDLQIAGQIKHDQNNAQEAPELVTGTPSKINDFLNQLSERLENGQNLLEKIADQIHALIENINEVESYLWGNNSIQALLRNTANEVRQLDENLEKYLTEEFKQTQVYKDFRKNVDDLKQELNDLQNNLLKDIEIKIGNVKVTLNTKEITEEMIDKATTEVDFIRESIETIRVESERIKNKLKREYDRIRNQINDLEDKVAKEIERVADRIDGWLSDVKKIADKITGALGNVEGALRSAINALSKAQEAVDAINDFLSGDKPLADAFRAITGHNPLHNEWEILGKLEKEILNGTYGVIKVKGDLRKGIEKISKELTTLAGADKKKTAERAVVKLINDGANKLLKKYGVSVCVVTPLDGAAKNDASVASSSSGTSSRSSSSAPIPTLPVLAEAAPVVKSTAFRHVNNAKNKKWRNSSASPYDKLPKIPWNGDDNSNYIEQTKRQHDRDFLIAYWSGYPQAIIMQLSPHARTRRRGRRAERRLRKMMNKADNIKSSWKNDRYGFRNNPSVWSYPTDAFDYKSEEVSQWVRATYPALDELRARVREKYKKDLKESNFTTYFIAWTYRYALSESFYCRSGMTRPYKDKGGNYVAKEPASMYVIPGTNPKNKGNEPMWTNPKLREQTIDKYFTVTATVQKTRPPIGNVKIFKRLGAEKGTAAIAEAFVYPANGRNEVSGGSHLVKTKSESGMKLQPFTAWDTLGWKNLNPGGPPEFAAQEWNSQPTLGGSKMSYADLMKQTKTDGSKRTKVEFTWNACMCPVTESKLRRLADNKEDADDALRAAAKSAAEHASVVSQ